LYCKIAVHFVVGYKLSPVQQFIQTCISLILTGSCPRMLCLALVDICRTVVQGTTCNQQQTVL